MLERLAGAEGMQARNGPSQNFKVILVFQIGRMATLSGKNRKAITQMLKNTGVFQLDWRHNGQLCIKKALGKAVLLQDRTIRPSVRAIELGNHKTAVLEGNLVDPIFVGIQRCEPASGFEADAFHGVQHGIRGEQVIGCLAWV